MIELIQFAFEPVNFFFTLLLGLVLIYWITVILGLFDLSLFDVDLDMDGDVDVQAEGGIFHSIAEFFALGDVPLMVLLSVLILSLWTLSMIVNHYLNPNDSVLVALAYLVPELIVACGVTKIVLIPAARLFSGLTDEKEAAKPIIGQLCIVMTTEVSKKLGQAEIATGGNPILLNVVSSGDHVFHKGDEAVIVDKDDKRGIYLIAPLKMEK